MKNLIALSLITFVTFGLVSCKGKYISPSSGIAGNWSVVSDSSISSGNKYIGQPSDYYDFTAKGKLYAKEGDFLLDTADYTVDGKNLHLVYNYLYEGGATVQGAVGNLTISDLTQSTLTLNSGGLTPEGYIGNIVVLKRK